MNTSRAKLEIIPLMMLLFFLEVLLPIGKSLAEEPKKDKVDNRYSLGIILGKTYDPTNYINFYMFSGSVLYDYEKIWHHRAPDPLRFKAEYNIGIARDDKTRFMTSLNMFALYYLNLFDNNDIKPYVEGGIGIIYTSFQVKGQGLKFNFNPQMGVGAEFKTKSRNIYFLSIRLHHISNGGIDKDNRGVNSALLMIGR